MGRCLGHYDLAVAQWVFKNARMAGFGKDTFFSDSALYLPLKDSTGTIGVIVIEVVDLHQLFNLWQRQFLDTFVNQIIHSFERANLAEQAKELSIENASGNLA
ncbi:MAG: hypothetical protein ABL903_15285 [Methylococcales bacterium]